MNVYKVRGRIQLLESIDDSDEEQEFREYQYARLELLVEVADERDAAPTALKQYCENNKTQGWEWRADTEPKVEFVREIPEAEMMARLGAPSLFDLLEKPKET